MGYPGLPAHLPKFLIFIISLDESIFTFFMLLDLINSVSILILMTEATNDSGNGFLLECILIA